MTMMKMTMITKMMNKIFYIKRIHIIIIISKRDVPLKMQRST